MPNAPEPPSALTQRFDELLDAWLAGLRDDRRLRRAVIDAERVEIARRCREVLGALADAVDPAAIPDSDAPELAACRRALEELGRHLEARGVTPAEIAIIVMSLKDYWMPLVVARHGDDDAAAQRDSIRMFRLVDGLAVAAFEALLGRREATIARQAREILELATPVVKVWDRVLAVPLIGTLDSERTRQVLETLLGRIVEADAAWALVDVTGVPAIDTRTSQYLVETATAVRLLGARVIVTGMRPAIAQTLVHLGADLGDVLTRSTLAAGLRHALDALDQERRSRDG